MKLFAHLKDHMGKFFIIVLFLILQVSCDLKMPDYTSQLINVGIQQNGIEDAVPVYISQESLNQLELFMPDEDCKLVEENYEIAKEENFNVSPVLAYKGDNKSREKLNEIFQEPMLYVYIINQAKDAGNPQAAQVDLNQLVSFEKNGFITKVQIEQMINQGKEKLTQNENYKGLLKKETAVQYVKGEYNKVGVDMDKIRMDYLWSTGLMMALFTLFMIIGATGASYFSAKTGAQIGRDLRKKIFTKVMAFSNKEMDQFSTASLITRSTNDIQQIQLVLTMFLKMVMMAPILGIGAFIMTLKLGSGLGWIIAVALGIVCVIVGIVLVITLPKFKMMQTLIDKVNLISREIITGIPVIRAFTRERYEEKRFEGASKDLMKTQMFTQRVMSLMLPAMMLLLNLVSIAIVWFGAKGVDLGEFQVGDMMAVITYSMLIILSFMMLTLAFVFIPRAVVAAKRVDDVITTDVSIKDCENAAGLDSEKVEGKIAFHNVSFKYSEGSQNALTNINFEANPGETTAIIGSTGSGKTTLLNLIPRFYDVSEGSVTLDGEDIRKIKLHDLRETVGYVPQKGALFSGDIASNIKFASEDISNERMEKAADIAQARDFIEEKEDKFHSEIAEAGSNVSGGQKQRLAIARAIAKNPAIYLFDDSFSALDFKTDAKLRAELAKETAKSTVIIVAQRIATILHADKIIVLNEGEIVGEGTHSELLKKCETYREIASSQLSEQELAKGVN